MIEVRDIVKSFDRLRVLDGVSLDIGRSEVVAVTGPSGAGKTTLLQIIGTLDRPDSGTVVYDGEPVTAMNEKRLGFATATSASSSSFISSCPSSPSRRMS